MIAPMPSGGFFNKMMQGRSKMGVQQDPSQMGGGSWMDQIRQNGGATDVGGWGKQGLGPSMGNAAGSMMGSIGPSANFMNKFNVGSGGAGRAMMGAGGGFANAFRGLFGMGGKKKSGMGGLAERLGQMGGGLDPKFKPPVGVAPFNPQQKQQWMQDWQNNQTNNIPMNSPMPQEEMPMGADDSQSAIQGGMGNSIGPGMDMGQIIQKFGKKKQQNSPNPIAGMFGF